MRTLDFAKIEALTMKKCWSMSQLERRADLSHTTLFKLRTGDSKTVSMKTLGKLARAFGCEPDDLLLQK